MNGSFLLLCQLFVKISIFSVVKMNDCFLSIYGWVCKEGYVTAMLIIFHQLLCTDTIAPGSKLLS